MLGLPLRGTRSAALGQLALGIFLCFGLSSSLSAQTTPDSLANALYWAGECKAAEKEYLQLLKQVKAEEEPDLYQDVIFGLARVYACLFEYQKAKQLYFEARSLVASQPNGTASDRYLDILNGLAGVHHSMKDLLSAELYYQEYLDREARKGKSNSLSRSVGLNNISLVYYDQKKWDKAIKNYLEAIEIEKFHKDPYKSLPLYYLNLGRAYHAKKDFENTRKYFLLALESDSLAYDKADPYSFYFSILYNLSHLENELGNSEKAAAYALRCLREDCQLPQLSDQLDENWKEAILTADYISEVPVWDGLEAYYYALKGINPDGQLVIAQTAMAMQNRYLLRFEDENDLYTALKYKGEWANLGLWAASEAYAKKKSAKPFQEGLYFAEEGLAALLRSKLRKNEQLSLLQLPADWAKKEDDLRQAQKAAKLALINAGRAEEDAAQKAYNQAQIAYSQFQDELREQFPDYHQLNYSEASISVEAIQNLLGPNRTMMIFLQSDSAAYRMELSQKRLSLVRLPIIQDSLEQQIMALRKMLTDYSGLKSQDIQLFKQRAHALYQFLFPEQMPAAGQELIFVNEGSFALLPFEVLLTDQKGEDFEQLSYLVRNYPISYSYSAELWMQAEQSYASSAQKLFWAMTANYEGTGLSPLPSANIEAQKLAQLMGGDYNAGAKESDFKQEAKDYRILHLAMHGLLNDKNPMLSAMAFSADKNEDGLLQAHEIAELDLGAELVVLSACQTGEGKLQTGEGSLSLARAFRYAGTPSLLMSLWQVNDQSTAYIMEAYYKGLQSGMTKSMALQQAKITYLENSKSWSAHPAFWAAFVQLGQTQPLQAGSNWLLWVWTLAVPLSLLLAYYFLFYKRGNREVAA
ncbi:CHAT domain-containing protein [Saprospira sp. CCB-QB6]|uniref:CHAT domain-containing protein n=1 Tax=Saprospira sp. CCB-QB6 TaxID=3023936 RepID=UPI0023494769|nr:CHAT domain-containing protein [Saprospira sp. CCB-QB6]WCL80462.1 CHAT domain-containing protein [Saprospira sp. CCB-QB6]